MNVTWHDARGEPKCAPDPAYPSGIDLDVSGDGAVATCIERLPYPARRCGYYLVECRTCGVRIIVTTAGRPDDPRSVKVACKLKPKGAEQ